MTDIFSSYSMNEWMNDVVNKYVYIYRKVDDIPTYKNSYAEDCYLLIYQYIPADYKILI